MKVEIRSTKGEWKMGKDLPESEGPGRVCDGERLRLRMKMQGAKSRTKLWFVIIFFWD